jgi:UDP-sulfoquinovose synthase
MLRREWVEEVGGRSVVPIVSLKERIAALERARDVGIPYWTGDLRDADLAVEIVRDYAPDVVVQMAECPSAPYSMIDAEHARFVQMNNLLTTFNLLFAVCEDGCRAHLVKLGTMGEYGTPGVPIPEGHGILTHRGKKADLPFPRQANSWYHWSKVHGSNNLSFAARLWPLRITDIMQGVVFGVYPSGPGNDPALATRLDADAVFGTVVHRWCVQAATGAPLTVYGNGGQSRGFIALQDSLRCIELLIRNPPEPGSYRVVNQLDAVHRLSTLARRVAAVAAGLGLHPTVSFIDNPRLEPEDHEYDVDTVTLRELGYRPRDKLDSDIRDLLMAVMKSDELRALDPQALLPTVRWTAPDSASAAAVRPCLHR